ncbi:GTP cyclohydrolase FolE2 [Castellaniella sp.]|uniref:GTP cyclohydrolase FolE2 n=1 Tax=Castellaniella sp. TaxID=1955812 RepID=UPI003565110A
MNTVLDPVLTTLPDVQGGPDTRQIPIQRVGVRGLRQPLMIAAGGEPQATIAEVEMTVALPASEKGTHMSRFIALLEEYRSQPLSAEGLGQMAQRMLDLLQVQAGDILLAFPYFVAKQAPVSGARSLMDYQVSWQVRAQKNQPSVFVLQVQVPVTSLCPCSKAISRYGAHNQRSLVTLDLGVALGQVPDLAGLIARIEAQASCELWGLLKRADEKYVTEHAYENPKFVEDLVRDVAMVVQNLPGVSHYRVQAENFESIHNHSAYAMVSSH